MSFSPIAIVGRANLLPGAHTPAALLELTLAGRDVLGDASAERWRVDLEHVLCSAEEGLLDHAWTRRGGYVEGFSFDASGLAVDPGALSGLDPLFLWVLHTARDALRDAGVLGQDAERTGAVVGNLSLPSEGQVAFAEEVWLRDAYGDSAAELVRAQRGELGFDSNNPHNRFNSGLPAHLLGRALGLGRPSYSMDAACASSLYAVELACRELHAGRADRMIAGAVNRADDLFIHVGFAALGALSRSGQSRPFHAHADGLVPGEGAGMLVLERLEDAVRAGRTIHGVIRGVGLANDGRGKGLLAPTPGGQERSMRLAFAQSGLQPAEVPYVECHATGTRLGDATELASMGAVYGHEGFAGEPRRIGSLKANMGHLITAAGVAGLIKVLEAMRAEVVPPTPHLDALNPALSGSGFTPLHTPEPWRGPRRAGVSAFGFGGNDAHLLVEAHEPARPIVGVPVALAPDAGRVAVVALGARVAGGESVADLERLLFEGDSPRPVHEVALPIKSLRFPPADLQKTSPQQTLLLAATLEAVQGLSAAGVELDRERTGVFIGYQCDPQIGRWGARWRAPSFAGALGQDESFASTLADAFYPALESAHVVGSLPNIPANRLSNQLDLMGPSFTVSAEELSGVRALEIAIERLALGELDQAIVGAVDFAADEPVQRAALAGLGVAGALAADGAVSLVLMRADDAERRGLPVLAELCWQAESAGAPQFVSGLPAAPAASGLIEVVGAIVSTARGRLPDGSIVDAPMRRLEVEGRAFGGERSLVHVTSTGPTRPRFPELGDEKVLRLPVPASVALPPLRVPLPAPGFQSSPSAPDSSPAIHHASAPSAATSAAPPVPSTTPQVPSMTQKMSPAPALPSTTFEAPPQPVRAPGVSANGAAAPTAVAAAVPPAVPVATASPSATAASANGTRAPQRAPARPSSAPSGSLAAFTEHQRRVADAHARFVEQQSALHRAFLETLAMVPGSTPGGDLRAELAALTRSQGASGIAPAVAPAEGASHATRAAGYASAASALAPAAGVVPVAGAAVEPVPALATPALAAPAHATPRTAATSAPAHALPAAPVRATRAPTPPPSTLSAKAPHLSPPPARPAAAAAAVKPPAVAREAELPLAFRPRGPSWGREELMVHSSGRISEIFGPEFAPQDGYELQVRMPESPLLLADRVTGIEAEPLSMKKGTCWTETDVREDSWYLHDGRMPAGIMIESGQADLFLISYLGIDMLNKGERAYRLLGCEMKWLGELPKIGETLAYDIHVDGHASQGDIRLFFFHYDCHVRQADGTTRPALQVRNGQAGFFTREELDDSAGVIWTPEQQEIEPAPRLDPPAVEGVRARSFSKEEIEAFAEGRPWECFDEKPFLRTKTHTRTPRIQAGRMLFIDQVDTFDPAGGPWGRGYLKATQFIPSDHWFFDGHFKNDPCMPGTLMLEGCVQTMAFYLTAMGYTVNRDGWTFQPVDEENYPLVCRGQVLPENEVLTYEVFVEEVHDGPVPMLYADLLCTVDGLKAFHARRFGLRLTPDFPMSSLPEVAKEGKDDPRAAVMEWKDTGPFRFDTPSLMACAYGKPSDAFGPMYGVFDGHRRSPRLPTPPYHFMTRVTKVDGAMGGMEVGSTIEVEYDVPPDVWYFDENGARVMPFAVLLEAALQPCGWLASYAGSVITKPDDLLFRNLDGKGTIKAEVVPSSGTFRTKVSLTNISIAGDMIIESFKVHCYVDDLEVYDLDTVFGFFPPEAFVDQPGLPTTPEQRLLFDAPENLHVDLTAAPEKYCGGTLRLAEPMLLMIDRVVHFDPKGGPQGLGALRAEKDVDPNEWFFKAHFYSDPVQPGSLGIEAMLQVLQWYMIESGVADYLVHPRFQGIASDHEHVWKYRGQVIPENAVITTTMEIVEVGKDKRGVYVLADASLWVDGKRIYEAHRLGMHAVEGPPGGSAGDGGGTPDPKAPEAGGASAGLGTVTRAGVESTPVRGEGIRQFEETLDDGVEAWLRDHRPTLTRPALPMMSMVARMMAAARASYPEREIDGLHGLEVLRWVVVDGPSRVLTEVEGDEVRVLAWREASDARLSRFELVARAQLGAPAGGFAPLAPLQGGSPRAPYADDRLFHGASFHYGRELLLGDNGSRLTLAPQAGAVPPLGAPFGARSPLVAAQGLLDALTHGIPHDGLDRWSSRIGDDVVGYPRRLDVVFHDTALENTALPETLLCDARFLGFADDDPRYPMTQVRLASGPEAPPLLELRLTEILMPKGPIGEAAPTPRRRFLEGTPSARHEVGLATFGGEGEALWTTLRPSEVSRSDWFPGTMQAVYRTQASSGPARAAEIAAAEHVAELVRRDGLVAHPGQVRVDVEDATGRRAAHHPGLPLTTFELELAGSDPVVVTTDRVRLDISPVKDFWRDYFGIGAWPVEDLYYALLERFVGRFRLVDPEAIGALRGRSVLYLANHQVGIESLLFSIVSGALSGQPTLTLAKIEHQQSWLGKLIAHCFRWPTSATETVRDPGVITHFDRSDPSSLPRIVKALADQSAAKSLMVHVEGTRSHTCRAPVSKMSGVFTDLAIQAGVPIVPVRFVGGLPVEPVAEKLEYPVGMGRQDTWLGAPILPEELGALPYKERVERVVAAINGLGPAHEMERPAAPDLDFAARVAARSERTGVPVGLATLVEVLAERPQGEVSAEVVELLRADARDGHRFGDDPSGHWLAQLAGMLLGR